MIIIASIVFVFCMLALGVIAINGIFNQYLNQADLRVKRFEEQLKEQRNDK